MIPLFKPYMPNISGIEKVLESGQLAYGRYTIEFEEKLRDYFGTQYLIVTNSFNTAISVALTTLGIIPGNAILASPMSCLASTQSYLSSGLNIKWADVDPRTGTMSPDFVRKAITAEIKAIVHNHFCGYPGYIEEINQIGKEYGVPVIDDGIECFGSEYKGRKIGNCDTDVSVFSLSAVRFCNCIDGGVIIFKDKRLFEKSLLIRDCGIDRSRFRDALGEINPQYDISLIGYSATMSNINGYIGLKQMEEIEDLLKKHREQAKKWYDYLENQSGYHPIYRENCRANYWVFGMIVDNKIETIRRFRDIGYQASGVHMRNDYYSVFGKQETPLPGVDEFYNSFVALPSGWWM